MDQESGGTVNDDMLSRDEFEKPEDAAPDQLRELTEAVIRKGLADVGIKALDPIANPPREPTAGDYVSRGL